MKYFKKQKSALLTLLVLAVGTSFQSCAVSEAPPKTVHEPAAIPQPVTPASEQGSIRTPGDPLTSINTLELEALLKEKDNEADKKVIQILKPFVLNQRFVQDQVEPHRPLLQKFLALFNEAMVRLSTQEEEAVYLRPLLSQYVQMAEMGCDDDLRGCVNLNFFRTDPLSAAVILSHARNLHQSLAQGPTKALHAYYRQLALVTELGNNPRSIELENLYLSHGMDYLNLLQTEKQDAAQELSLIHI